MQFARLAGARVIAAERTQTKRDWALSLGATDAIEASKIGEAVRGLTDGKGVDCVFDIVGTEATMAAGLDALSVGGRIAVVGYTPDTFSLSGKRVAQNEFQVIGSRGGTRKELAEALSLTASGRVRSIVTDTAPLDAVNDALTKLRRGEVIGRLVLDIAADAA